MDKLQETVAMLLSKQLIFIQNIITYSKLGIGSYNALVFTPSVSIDLHQWDNGWILSRVLGVIILFSFSVINVINEESDWIVWLTLKESLNVWMRLKEGGGI